MIDSENFGPDGALPSLRGTWRLDPGASTVSIRSKALWGMATVTGSLRVTEGSATVGDDGAATGSLVVDAGSIDTAQAKRDKHLRSKDFFDVEHHPVFSYAVTSAALGVDGAVSVVGRFTARGQTRPLPVAGALTSPDPATITVTVEADLDRSDWGMDWTRLGARLDTHVTAVAVFRRS